jgi:hypothetical protein
MEIILVIRDKKGKNILFITNDFRSFTAKELIDVIEKGILSGLHLVFNRKGMYIRSNPNAIASDNLDSISISFGALIKGKQASSLSKYHQKRKEFLKNREKQKETVVCIDGKPRKTEKEVIAYLTKHKECILAAARKFKIDSYLLGAILIDEDLRRDWKDDWFDCLARIGSNFSVGVAQIKVSTAKNLIQKGYYNPDPTRKKLSSKELYEYLKSDKHSVYFAAAEIKRTIDEWRPLIDLSKRPEIIGTLYSLGKKKKPHANPKPNDRGEQIKNEFYKIAIKVLRS